MKKLFYLAILSWLIPQGTPACAQSLTPAAKTAARERIIRQAPIVIVGRPLQAEFYKDVSGKIYRTTVLQILEVLRGGGKVQAGTVEWVDSLEQTPQLEESFRFGGTSVYDREWGVYFGAPSTYPARNFPYQTSNRPLILKPQGSDKEAKVQVLFGDDGSVVQGLYRGWGGEELVPAYINSLPRIKPLVKGVDASRYPKVQYRDNRPGGMNIYAPDARLGSGDKVVETLAEAPNSEPTGPPVKGKSMPLKAFKQLPVVMERIRSKEPLSKQDSAFIKCYIPEQMPTGPRADKRKGPRPKKKKPTASVLGARLTSIDTTLFLAVRNLTIERPVACERAYQGEVWLKANQEGLYMNQLYFEMSTTADLKLDSSPFGQTLVGTYTPLAGAPGYTFYQSYDAATKHILVACYPSWSNPQRVQLATTGAQPFFRFQYGVVEQSPPPGGGGPSPQARGVSEVPPTVAFTPLATNASRSYSNFYLSQAPTSGQERTFISLQAEAAAEVEQPQPLRIDSLRTENGLLATAGTGMVLTIYGSNFGPIANPADTTQRVRIQFVNADAAPSVFLRDVYRRDIMMWSEKVIRLRIPSWAIGVGPGAVQRGVGGGVIRITTCCGREAQSVESLDIKYSLTTQTSQPVYLLGRDCSRGLTFYLNAEIAANPMAVGAIRKALRDWSVELRVPLVLSPTILSANTLQADDGQIVFYPSDDPRPMLTNRTPALKRDFSGAARWTAPEMDISISRGVVWNYDTTGASICTPGRDCDADFYASVLHEVGHVLGLKHVVDRSDIMFYALAHNPRGTLTTGRKAAVEGALRSVANSKLMTWDGLLANTFGQPFGNCSQNRMANATTSPLPVTKESNLERATLFPNPVSDEAEILPSTADKGPWEYWVRDVQGRVVLHAQGAGTAAIKVGKGLPAGFYTIQLHTPQNTSTLKMIKGL